MTESPPRSTYRVRLEAELPAAGRIANALDETAGPQALSVSYFDLGNGFFEVSALYAGRPDENTLQALVDRAADGDRVSPLLIGVLPDENWITVSQGQRRPVRAGRFLVHGSHDRDKIVRTRYTIEIDADQAFGTAHHATTRGCLIALDELAKWGRPDLILDVGTGTGVLAIAAALAFDRPAIATDNDPVAVRIAKENAAKAGVAQKVHVFVANGLSHPSLRRLRPDLVVANILARPLYDLAPAMARTVEPGGYVLLSGITGAQAQATAARYGSLGFSLEKRILLDGWAVLLLGRRKASVLFD
ncbi:MAG: 50S ribosomal protein L11 methyltransferase [Methyloceanibacter sp.]|uniref:50S ribosomal protein L11 methyltransferase n=1 Tax=Methyloceanibacter sp. TaxID=1965321 RepID=UPI001D814152|nr:50S ribosomal protein L11 methyltransferase [Methyloceanibacter sp.]MCB1443188.1 50S ribosomal protein L11 methyltransferase [Methyloceanibacter sp.]MCC0058449.1 50S ribosomal protein L11 methyltransferase [Hyphomicrobiaceae bacterium]